jgi:hypothetical protein
VGEGGDVLNGVQDAGRRLGVDDEDRRRRGRSERAVDVGRIHRLAPRRPRYRYLGARAAGDLLEEEAEPAILDDDDPLAGFDQAHDGRFHAGPAGSRHREGAAVPRAERASE